MGGPTARPLLQCRSCLGRLHDLREGCLGNALGEVWPSECASDVVVLWCILGVTRGNYPNTLNVHRHPLLHWLCWRNLCDEPVLVFTYVCTERRGHSECDCCRLGKFGRW